MAVKILKKESLIPGRTSRLVLEAPHIAETAKPGHFIILRINEKGERFPLTIADTDKKNGTITIVYLVMGTSTTLLENLQEGDEIMDVCGPLGRPTHIVNGGKSHKVICVGGGTGVAAMHHIAKGHRQLRYRRYRRKKQRPFALLRRIVKILRRSSCRNQRRKHGHTRHGHGSAH